MMKNNEYRVKGWLLYRLLPKIHAKDNVYFLGGLLIIHLIECIVQKNERSDGALKIFHYLEIFDLESNICS